MKKSVLTGLIALAVVCAFSMTMVSCAKKQVRVSGAVEPAQQEGAVTKAPAGGAAATTDKGYDAREAARQKKLRELEKSQLIADFESRNIYFDFDKSELKPESKAVLKEKAEFMTVFTEYALRVDGHCDERGTVEYNLALGERRAHAAKQYMMDLGISAHRISTVSYGEERPANPGHGDEAWAENRRDEFSLIKRW